MYGHVAEYGLHREQNRQVERSQWVEFIFSGSYLNYPEKCRNFVASERIKLIYIFVTLNLKLILWLASKLRDFVNFRLGVSFTFFPFDELMRKVPNETQTVLKATFRRKFIGSCL